MVVRRDPRVLQVLEEVDTAGLRVDRSMRAAEVDLVGSVFGLREVALIGRMEEQKVHQMAVDQRILEDFRLDRPRYCPWPQWRTLQKAYRQTRTGKGLRKNLGFLGF